MAENVWLSMTLERYREREKQKAENWQRAVERLSVEFEADHGGGYPDCLKGLTPDERVEKLRALGFRVKGHFTLDVGPIEGPPEYQPWIRISGRIAVNLSDGWVSRGAT